MFNWRDGFWFEVVPVPLNSLRIQNSIQQTSFNDIREQGMDPLPQN